MDILVPLVAFGTSAFLLASGFAKFDSWGYWSSAVEGWLPRRWTSSAARVAIPGLELAVGGLASVAPRAGLGAATFLLLAFAAGVAALTIHREGYACGCFGKLSESRISKSLALRNVALAMITGATFIASGLVADPIRGLGPVGIPIATLTATLLLLSTSGHSMFQKKRRLSRAEGGA